MGRMSIGSVIYLVIGVVVAAGRDHLDQINNLSDFFSAALAILLWPLILLGVDINL